MTGTGTEQDPYICDTWEELLSVTKAANVYAKISDSADKIVDLNQIKPEGYSEYIELSGHIDFNGLVVKNLRSTARYAIYIRARNSGNGWKNLTFENFYHQYSSAESKNFAFVLTDSGGITISVDNCHFYGLVNYSHSNSSGTVQIFRSDNYRILAFEQCSFNVDITCKNHAVTVFRAKYLKDCNVKINADAESMDIIEHNSSSEQSNYFFNSLISGKINVSDTTTDIYCGNQYSGYNCFNLQTNTPLVFGGYGTSVFNRDLSPDTVSAGSFAGCTSEQLKNADYLYSVGFPCYR